MRFPAAALAFAAAAFVALPSAATTLPPHSPVFIERDASQPASVSAGEEFLVALASNVTTGYSWTATIGDATVLSSGGNAYQPPGSPAMGAGGQQIFLFNALRPGSTTITFEYRRPFDPPGTIAKTLVFNVAVK